MCEMLLRPSLVALLLVAVSCGGEDVPSRVTGVIVDVESEGEAVTGFTLESDDESFEISISEDVDYGFDLNHLNEHMETEEPVDVMLEERDDELVALSIEDV